MPATGTWTSAVEPAVTPAVKPSVLEHLSYALDAEEDGHEAMCAAPYTVAGWSRVAQELFLHAARTAPEHDSEGITLGIEDFLPPLEAAIGRLKECLAEMESQARELERHEMERRREALQLHFSRDYIDKRLADNEQGIEKPDVDGRHPHRERAAAAGRQAR